MAKEIKYNMDARDLLKNDANNKMLTRINGVAFASQEELDEYLKQQEDVIFGGTEKRGALGFAQVSLIIDNSERIFIRLLTI